MFEIRPAAPEDQQAIRHLQRLNPYPLTPLQEKLTCFVACAGSQVVGAAAAEFTAGKFGLVRLLAVLPGYRKHEIGRQLLLRLIAFGEEQEALALYAPGLYAGDYFSRFGFVHCSPEDLPPELQEHPFPGIEKFTGKVMARPLRDNRNGETESDVTAAARRYFDGGFFCAESVLAAVAEQLKVESPLIPGIATGFCSGTSGTWGTCGAISGGILAINMMLGRRRGDAPVNSNYQAVKDLIKEFHCRHGSTQCSELIACDLDSKEGRKIYKANNLRRQCREYVGTAAAISLQIIRKNPSSTVAAGDPAP